MVPLARGLVLRGLAEGPLSSRMGSLHVGPPEQRGRNDGRRHPNPPPAKIGDRALGLPAEVMNVALFLAACTPPATRTTPPQPPPAAPWAPPDEAGPYAVGVRTVAIDDGRGGELTVEVWTPSEDEGALADYGLPFTPPSIALRDAPVRGRGHPLVMFSHGHGGARHQSIFLTERLASHGFVVVAVDHPHDTLFDYDPSLTPTVAARRPGDISRAIDWALAASEAAEHWLGEAIRPDGIGMLGHSFGAWTTLALAGGTVDIEAAAAACAATDPPAGCNIVGTIDTDLPVPAPDDRITAAAALAPGGWYSFSALHTLGDVLVISGTADEDLPFDEEQDPTYQALGSPRSRLLLEGGGHFGFTDACALVPLADCAGEAAGFMDPVRMQVLTMAAAAAFFGVHLRGDDRYAAWLEPDAWPEDAVWASE